MIYAFGSNGAGQLGIDHKEDTATPQLVKFRNAQDQEEVSIATVRKIVAGGNHTLVLDAIGKVYAAGSNEDGRCVWPDIASTSVMREIKTPFTGGIHNISATWSASFFVASNQKSVFACGRGDHGELGLGDGVITASQLTQLKPFDTTNIVQISSSISHTVVVFANGQVWGWGRGRNGQLGQPAVDVWTPREITDVPFAAVAAVAGSVFTCVFGAPASGELLLLGSDRRDRFQLRTDVPRSITSWTSISTCWSTIYVLLDDHSCVAWGRNDRGQIPPHNLPPVVDLAAGSEHWLALSSVGEVLTGGWGEHGNCGTATDANGVVKDRFSTIPTAAAVGQVFAGCATSFLVMR